MLLLLLLLLVLTNIFQMTSIRDVNNFGGGGREQTLSLIICLPHVTLFLHS